MASYLDQVLQQLQGLPAPKAMSVSGNTPNSGLINQLFSAQNQANAANTQRFNISAGLLTTQGQAAKTDVAQQAAKSTADMNQGLMNRGLYNTSTFAPLQQGITREANRQNESIDEQTAGGLASLIGQRNDNGPNASLISQLLQSSVYNRNPGIASPRAASPTPSWQQTGGLGQAVSQNIPHATYLGPGQAGAQTQQPSSAYQDPQMHNVNDGYGGQVYSGGYSDSSTSTPMDSSQLYNSPFQDLYSNSFGGDSSFA